MKEGFSELYTRLYNENIQELETLRAENKKAATKILLIIAAIFICCIIQPFLAPVVIIVVLVIAIINASKNKNSTTNNSKKSYKEVFKEKIVAPLISNVFEGGTYEPNKGLSIAEYRMGEYRDDIDRYSSEDMITAPVILNNNMETVIRFAEVHTQRESRDKDGHTSYVTQFYGLAGSMPLNKSINSKIYIKRDGFGSFFSSDKVKMDMSEFEKLFDVEAEDKILAVRILTSDVMTEMIDLYRKFKYSFDIHIINNTIYMRISTGEVFEPNIFKNAMEYATIEKYYLVLQALMNISKHIYETINEIEI